MFTQGNAESSTLGFKNTLAREWDRSLFTLRAGGTRVNTTSIVDEFAVGTADDFSVDDRRGTDDRAPTSKD